MIEICTEDAKAGGNQQPNVCDPYEERKGGMYSSSFGRTAAPLKKMQRSDSGDRCRGNQPGRRMREAHNRKKYSDNAESKSRAKQFVVQRSQAEEDRQPARTETPNGRNNERVRDQSEKPGFEDQRKCGARAIHADVNRNHQIQQQCSAQTGCTDQNRENPNWYSLVIFLWLGETVTSDSCEKNQERTKLQHGRCRQNYAPVEMIKTGDPA